MTSSIYELKKIGKLNRNVTASLKWQRRSWQNWVDETGRFLVQYAGTYVEEPPMDVSQWNMIDYYTRKQYVQSTYTELTDLAERLHDEWMQTHPPAETPTEPESLDRGPIFALLGGVALLVTGAVVVAYLMEE